jgi:hypothetical protein
MRVQGFSKITFAAAGTAEDGQPASVPNCRDQGETHGIPSSRQRATDGADISKDQPPLQQNI